LGQEFIIDQYFKNDTSKFFVGNFTNNGNLESVNPFSEKENIKYRIEI